MTRTEILKYLKEGTEGSDVTKTDVFLNSVMREASKVIEELVTENTRLKEQNLEQSWIISPERMGR
jgi:hypothetical protein